MNGLFFKYLTAGLLLFLIAACLPDRMAPAPEENTRPQFVRFGGNDSAGLNIALNDPVVMYFDEPMDLNTFPGNFHVQSISGEIPGVFEYDVFADSAVVFKPMTNFNPAEVYEVSISGKVRDTQGNSALSPNEEDAPVTNWFFTTGQYAQNGFPYIFLRDKSSKQVIYRIHTINSYKDSLYVPATAEDYQTAAIESFGDYLFMVNLKTSAGTVTVIDPHSLAILKVIDVGLGPTNICFSETKAFVTNNSGKSFSAISLATLQTETTVSFSDGFKPKDVVYSTLTNKLYFTSSTATKIKVVSAADYNNSYDLSGILGTKKAVDIEISGDGKYIFLPEEQSGSLIILSAETEQVVNTLNTGYGYNIDGVIGGSDYFLSFFKKVGKEYLGGILKMDVATQTISDKIEWERSADQLGLTAAGELLYAVIAQDSTVQIIETGTMRNISQTKINGSLKNIAVSPKNY
jgi:hypothetical protein